MSTDREKRIKDLMARLVEMAPEPPPYPEEEVIMTPPSARRRRRPLLAFAAAAALVLAVGLPLVFVGGGSDPAVTTPPTEPAPSTPPSSEPAPSTTVTTVEDEPLMVAQEVVVYLAHSPESSFTGDPALVAFAGIEEMEPESSPIMAALRALSSPALVLPPGYHNTIPSEVEVLDVSVAEMDGPVFVVDMNHAFLEGAGGLLADLTMLNQLVYTVTHWAPNDRVLFTVEGDPILEFGTDGLDLSEPIGRDDFLDSVNSILVTEPVLFGGDGLPQVVGRANVFEATVSLRILDEEGEVVYEEFTTATCGTGCWGDFDFTIDTSALTAESTIQVFWHSAEDGEPADVVTIPLSDLPGGYWPLTLEG